FIKTAKAEIVFNVQNKIRDVHSHPQLVAELRRAKDVAFLRTLELVDLVIIFVKDSSRLRNKITFDAIVKTQLVHRLLYGVSAENKWYAKCMIAKRELIKRNMIPDL